MHIARYSNLSVFMCRISIKRSSSATRERAQGEVMVAAAHAADGWRRADAKLQAQAGAGD